MNYFFVREKFTSFSLCSATSIARLRVLTPKEFGAQASCTWLEFAGPETTYEQAPLRSLSPSVIPVSLLPVIS